MRVEFRRSYEDYRPIGQWELEFIPCIGDGVTIENQSYTVDKIDHSLNHTPVPHVVICWLVKR